MSFDEDVKYRGRGLKEFEKNICSLEDRIVDSLSKNAAGVRLLELGCGFGSLMLELNAKFKDQIFCAGINRFYTRGNYEVLKRNYDRLEKLGRINSAALPSLVISDISDGLPFADNTFHAVVSQVAWKYFGNKLTVLTEVVRVMKPEGFAIIELYGDPSPLSGRSLIQCTDLIGQPSDLDTTKLAYILGFTKHGRGPRNYLLYAKQRHTTDNWAGLPQYMRDDLLNDEMISHYLQV
jgi:ubiquinone/menaquinone biosynthesis C-methylase UbiE